MQSKIQGSRYARLLITMLLFGVTTLLGVTPLPAVSWLFDIGSQPGPSPRLAGRSLLGMQTAHALPPPKTEQELMEMSDLVVDAECVEIQCQGPPVEDAEKITTTYLSTLFPSFSYKGGMPNSIQIRGELYDWKNAPPIGGWHQEPVPEGWVGKLYLEQLTDGTYTKVWWNAMEEDPNASHPQPLPSCEQEEVDGGVADGAVEPDGSADPDGGQQPDGAGEPDGGLPPDDAAADPDGGTTSGVDDRNGCSCSTPAASGDGAATVLGLLLFALGGAFLRRRRKK